MLGLARTFREEGDYVRSVAVELFFVEGEDVTTVSISTWLEDSDGSDSLSVA